MSVESLGTSPHILGYASVSGDIDLIDIGGSPCRWIKNGGGGDIVIVDAKGNTVTLFDPGAGGVEMVAASKILASGTTATNINVYF